MKRVAWLLVLICMLCGCGEDLDGAQNLPRMVFAEGALYVDSGRISKNTPRCGVMDGEITQQVNPNEIPTKEGTSNFDAGDGYQIGTNPDTIELNLEGQWCIFCNVQKPPEMRVVIGKEELPSLRGGFTWTGIAKNGKAQTIVADALHPLEAKELVPILTLRPTVYSAQEPNLAYLDFDLLPDRITARRWSASDWGNPKAQGEEVTVESATIRLEEHFIYEITATWDIANGFGGEVTYAFYTNAPKLCGYPLAE